MKKLTWVWPALAAALFLSVAGAAELQVPNRLASAQIGEWASFSMPNDYIQKQTVINRTGEGPTASVVVRIENFYNGQLVNATDLVKEAGEPYHPLEMPEEPGASIRFYRKIFEVKGTMVNTIAIEIEYDDAYDGDDEAEDSDEVTWFLSSEVPVFGIVRQLVDDDVEYELVDFGWN